MPRKSQILSMMPAASAILFTVGCTASKPVSQTQVLPPQKETVQAEKQLAMQPEKVFEIFRKNAQSGDAAALAALGKCYYRGYGVPADPVLAAQHFQQAADRNNADGLNGLGLCKLYGKGTAADTGAARELFLKAAQMEHPEATLNLAKIYAERSGKFFNPKKAESSFQKALTLNTPNAEAPYGCFLFDQKRYAQAFALLRKATPDSAVRRRLACCFLNGWGTAIDVSQAVRLAEENFRKAGAEKWSASLCFDAGLEEYEAGKMTDFAAGCFRLAAKQGNTAASYILARRALANRQTEQALALFRAAADSGCAPAMLEAGKLLMKQPSTIPLAEKYFMLAMLHRNTQKEAICALSALYRNCLKQPRLGLTWDARGAAMDIGECRNRIAFSCIAGNRDEDLARGAAELAVSCFGGDRTAADAFSKLLDRSYKTLRRLADQKNPDALIALGVIGITSPKGHPNVAIGVELLEKAAANSDDGTAFRLLGMAYSKGSSVECSLQKAFRCFQAGAERGDALCARHAVLLPCRNPEEFEDLPKTQLQRCFDKAIALEAYDVAYEYGVFAEKVQKNRGKAEKCYRQAAARQDSRAMLALSDLLSAANPDESAQFLLQAAEQQNSEAELRMSELCRRHELPRQAYIWALKAKHHGNKSEAPCLLAQFRAKGYGCERDWDIAGNNAMIAFDNGNAEICYLLGVIFRDGKAGVKNWKKAKACFAEGVTRGNVRCRQALSQLYKAEKMEKEKNK